VVEELSDEQKIRNLIEKLWVDPKLKAKFKEKPKEVLDRFGISTPEGCSIKVIESDTSSRYFVIPPAPDSHLSEEEVKKKSDNSDYRVLVHVLYDVNCC
jgi:Nitrile hydratase, alpha chain